MFAFQSRKRLSSNPGRVNPHPSGLVPGPSLRLALFGAKFRSLLQDDARPPRAAAVAAALHAGRANTEGKGLNFFNFLF